MRRMDARDHGREGAWLTRERRSARCSSLAGLAIRQDRRTLHVLRSRESATDPHHLSSVLDGVPPSTRSHFGRMTVLDHGSGLASVHAWRSAVLDLLHNDIDRIGFYAAIVACRQRVLDGRPARHVGMYFHHFPEPASGTLTTRSWSGDTPTIRPVRSAPLSTARAR